MQDSEGAASALQEMASKSNALESELEASRSARKCAQMRIQALEEDVSMHQSRSEERKARVEQLEEVRAAYFRRLCSNN